MSERAITPFDLKIAIEKADSVVKQDDKYIAKKRFGRNVLLVVYKIIGYISKEEEIIFIITVIYSSKVNKYLP